MDRAAGPTKVRFGLARDQQGRLLFLPWHPLSRTAYVLGAPAQGEAVARRIRLSLLVLLALLVAQLVASPFVRWPAWAGLPLAAALLLAWAGWTRRVTRGLERTRYEPPAPR